MTPQPRNPRRTRDTGKTGDTRPRRKAAARWGDSGASSVISLLLVIPLVLGLTNMVFVAGQLMLIKGDLELASGQGARVASLRATFEQGEADGRVAARRVIEDQGVSCANFEAALDRRVVNGPHRAAATNFAPGGIVAMTVTCRVPLVDLGFGIPGLGTKTMRATSAEVLETFREFD